MKRKTMISSILVIVLCLGLISGSTFALFTSTSSVNIAVTSGKVDVKASLSNLNLFSANANIETGDKAIKTTDTSTSSADGTLTGTFAGTYYYQPQEGEFLNGGTANYEAPTLTIDKMTPGDKVKTTLSLTNDSNVDIQYRLRIDANENSNEDLLSVLKLEFNGKLYTGLSKFTSAWTKVSTTDSLESKDISIIFPLDIDDQKYMEKTVSLVILVEAVQGNANTSGDEEVETVVGKIINYAPATAQLSQGTQDTNVDYVKTTQNIDVEIESKDIVATSIIPGDTVFFMDKPGNTDYIPLGQAEGDGSLSRMISTTATSETSAVIDISYKYTDSDGITTDVTGFSNIVTNIVNVDPGLLNVSVTRTHNGTTVTMTEGFDPTTGEGFSYDVSTGVLTIKSKLYSDYNMTFVTPVAKVVSDSTTTYHETFDEAFDSSYDNSTIVLLADVDYAAVYHSNKTKNLSYNLTLDLNAHSLVLGNYYKIAVKTGAYYTVKDGTYSSGFATSPENNSHIKFENVEYIKTVGTSQGFQLYGKTNVIIDFVSCEIVSTFQTPSNNINNGALLSFSGGTTSNLQVNITNTSFTWNSDVPLVTFSSSTAPGTLSLDNYSYNNMPSFNSIICTASAYRIKQTIDSNMFNYTVIKSEYWLDKVSSQPDDYVVEGDTISIGSAEAFAWFAKQYDSYDNALSGKTVVLTADLNMGAYLWKPIKCNFMGTFDGNNHTISNVTTLEGYQVTSNSTRYGNGIFHRVSGTVKDLTVSNSTIGKNDGTGNNNINGVIAGYCNGGTFSNVTVTNCWLFGFGKVGGLIGMQESGTTTLTNCVVNNTLIDGDYNCAGFVGLAQGVINISNCNSSNVTFKEDVYSLRYKYHDVTEENHVGRYWSDPEVDENMYYAAWGDYYTDYNQETIDGITYIGKCH